MSNPFEAQWTVKGSNLCLGQWQISYMGKRLELSAERKKNDMGTYAIYSYIYPDDDCYAEGSPEEAWISENRDWLTELFIQHGIPTDDAHFRWYYQAVNQQDWRCGSCGGCI